jgi:hypothetical protein
MAPVLALARLGCSADRLHRSADARTTGFLLVVRTDYGREPAQTSDRRARQAGQAIRVGRGGSVRFAAGSLIARTASSIPRGDHERPPEAGRCSGRGRRESEEVTRLPRSRARRNRRWRCPQGSRPPRRRGDYRWSTSAPAHLRRPRCRIDATTCRASSSTSSSSTAKSSKASSPSSSHATRGSGPRPCDAAHTPQTNAGVA